MTISITADHRHPAGAAGRRPRRAAAGRHRAHSGLQLATGDIVVVCQKVVSKAEGRIARLSEITASPFAQQIAAQTTDKDPRVVEVILRETKRIVKMDRGHLIVETGPGWVCANAGVDESNSLGPDIVILLPDGSRRLGAAPARRVRASARVSTSPSSSPTPSAGRGARAWSTSPSASPAWRRSSTCAASTT